MPTRVRSLPAPVHRFVRETAGSFALIVTCTLGGCTTNDMPTPEQRELQRAAIERYDRCIDRRLASFGDGASLGARRVVDCEGYRRDVLKTYPAQLGERVTRMLDERAVRRAGANAPLPADATARPIVERMMELLTGS